MKSSKFSDSQIMAILKQAEAGTPVPQLNRFGIRASMGGVGACWDNRHVNK